MSYDVKGEPETIFARATGAGKAAIAVYRVSGTRVASIASSMTRRSLPAPRIATLRKIYSQDDGDVIDEVLLLYFEVGASFTGEDLLEIHCHGGPATCREIEAALENLGARYARPGEFTRKRYDAGLLDLSQAEAIAFLVDAETKAQHRLALRVLDGEIGRTATAWRQRFIDAAALLEVGIDFVEEEVGDDTIAASLAAVHSLREEISAERIAAAQDSAALETPTVALLGPPNAGKSTLLNSLTRRDLAIVTDIPGTTRDPVRGRIVVDGMALELVDTAGLRDAVEPIEKVGVARSRRIAEAADLRVFVFSSDTWQQSAEIVEMVRPGDIALWAKADLSATPPKELLAPPFDRVFPVSVQDMSSVNRFVAALSERMGSLTVVRSRFAGSKRAHALLDQTIEDLQAAIDFIRANAPESAIEALRQAIGRQEALIGRVRDEDVLDAVFSRFCIGK